MLSARPAGLTFDADRRNLTKTPGRTLVKSRSTLQENALRNVPMTVIGKGKKTMQSTSLQLKTLQTDRVFQDPPGKQVGPSKLRDTPAVRPLGNRTPFPNRTAIQVTLGTGAKIAKPALLEGSLRPSSARKHVRLPRSASKSFETPVTGGHHWDVSDVDIEVGTAAVNQSIEEEDYGEIEYMPPKVEEIPYEPPFEMPNYKEVGKTLLALIRSYPIEDDLPSTTDISFTAHESEKGFFAIPNLTLPEIEDDSPFAQAKVKPEAPTKTSRSTAPSRKSPASNKPLTRPAVRQVVPATRTAPAARVPSTTRRPPAAPNTRTPAQTTRVPISQPTTRAPASQSTVRAPVSRAATRAPSAVRSAPSTRPGTTAPSRTTSVARPATSATTRLASVAAGKAVPRKPTTTITKTATSAPRPRSGTITKAAFESKSHVVAHVGNSSIEDAKKDLEGLIVFEDAFDEDEDFRFDV
ncbi:hypothetical protein HYDPIDRAFT_25469 [Hydnomerulius pinastri MD-312]|nr:hypothetical protein HYDPIDRAFT_25469 [Hydnomerulius pinastri MD-312]